MAAVPSAHPLAAHESLTLVEVAGFPLIVASTFMSGGASRHIENLFQERFSTLKVMEAAASLSALRTLVGAGMGIGLLTETQSEECPRSGIVTRPLSSKRARLPTYILRRKEAPSALISRFIEEAKATI